MTNRKFNPSWPSAKTDSPQAKRERYEALREKRLQLAQQAGFGSDKKLLGAVLKALSTGPLTGWHILAPARPCQQCGRMTEIANMYELQGWLLLQPICINCSANRGA